MLQLLPVTLLATVLGSGAVAAGVAADIADVAAVVPIVFVAFLALFFIALTVGATKGVQRE